MSLKKIGESQKNYFLKSAFIITLILVASFGRKLLPEKQITDLVFGKNINPKQKTTFNNFSFFNLKKQSADIYSQIVKSAQKEKDNIVGEATKFFTETASKSGTSLKEYLFANTVGNLLRQIDKLPLQEKEMIKKELCR
jgi:hypothetical protein